MRKGRTRSKRDHGGRGGRRAGDSSRGAGNREWLYGRRPVAECLRAGRRRVFGVIVAEGGRGRPDLRLIEEAAAERGVDMERAPAPRLNERVGDVNHQGIAMEVSLFPYEGTDGWMPPRGRVAAPEALILLLDHIQDPQNLGSILRTADAAGVEAVVIPKDRACGVTPAVVRASAGAAEHLRISRVVNLARLMREMRDRGFRLVGLDHGPEARLCGEMKLDGPLGLVAGSEGRGLGRLVRDTCDRLMRLPMRGRVDSLNVGVATAVALYSINRVARGEGTA